MPFSVIEPEMPLVGSSKGKVESNEVTRRALPPSTCSVPLWGVGSDTSPVRSCVEGVPISGVTCRVPARAVAVARLLEGLA